MQIQPRIIAETLTLSTHLIRALNSVSPNWISTEKTMVQYVLPFLPCFGFALPVNGERSARTTHNVENSPAQCR